ncbi:MAG: hypothetical protein ABSB35_24555, partial [Bryobacteraceae bacterium]
AVKLKDTLRGNRAIRRLATSPLLCGVICALHRDTNEQLPEDRVELYERCCAMLLERRDPESGLALGDYPRLSYRQKRALLDDLAYWMIKNEWTEVSVEPATDHLGMKLENLRTDARDGVAITAENVLRFFLERSGMLREPIEGKLDFAHRTFQEFMAAQAAVDEGDFGVLVNHASNPQWREVIVLGAGLARPHERRDLITLLLAKGDSSQRDRYQLHLLAAACLDTAVDLDSTVKREVEDRVAKLVPPAGMFEAGLLAAAAGEIAVPFLRRGRRLSAPKAAACVRALALIGSLEALQAIAGYADDGRFTVLREVARSAERFDPDSYLQLVVPHLDVSRLPEDVAGRLLAKYGIQELKGIASVTAVALSNPPPEVLAALHDLSALRSLALSGLAVDDLSALRGLTKLESLRLKGTHITDLSALRDFPNLKFLELDCHPDLTDITPLRDLTMLRRLHFTTSQNRDLGPLESMADIETLILDGPGIGDLSPLKNLPKLQALHLWGTEVSELSAVQGFPNLHSLALSSAYSLKDLSSLQGALQIRRLTLYSTTARDLSPLRGHIELRQLSLSGTGAIDLSPLQELPNLQSLEIYSFTISDLSPLAGLPRLTALDLRYAHVGIDQLDSLHKVNPRITIRR